MLAGHLWGIVFVVLAAVRTPGLLIWLAVLTAGDHGDMYSILSCTPCNAHSWMRTVTQRTVSTDPFFGHMKNISRAGPCGASVDRGMPWFWP